MTSQRILSRDELIELAVDKLEATSYASDTLYAYTETQMHGVVYMVTDDDMLDLGGRLARGETSAYSHWCADTVPESTTAEAVVVALPELHATGLDVNALREEAGAAGDYMTCAACDHIAQEIRALL